MSMNKFAQEVHQNAVAHGWWDDPRTFGEIISLCHSELSEALEELRAGRGMVWYACTEGTPEHPCNPKDIYDCEMSGQEASCAYRSAKPEGIAVELADCIIRVLDYWRLHRTMAPAPLPGVFVLVSGLWELCLCPSDGALCLRNPGVGRGERRRHGDGLGHQARVQQDQTLPARRQGAVKVRQGGVRHGRPAVAGQNDHHVRCAVPRL